LLSQFEQLRLFFVAFSNSVVESVELIFKHRISVPTAIRRVFNLAGGGISGSRKRGSAMVRLYDNADYSSSASADRELERDFFNTRKVIVVTTLAGFSIINYSSHILNLKQFLPTILFKALSMELTTKTGNSFGRFIWGKRHFPIWIG
jgi:hypothetical protein